MLLAQVQSAQKTMEKYQETQRFITSKWIILVVGITAVASASALISLAQNNTNTENIVAALLPILVLVLFAFLGVKTTINEQGVYVQFGFFGQRPTAFLWNDIALAKITKYQPLSDYGGWGYRRGFFKPNKRAYSVIGDIGLELTLKDGSVVMIGTQNPDYLKEYLQVLKSKYKIQAIVEAN